MTEQGECVICGTETENFSEDVGAFICSDECLTRRLDEIALRYHQQDSLEMQ